MSIDPSTLQLYRSIVNTLDEIKTKQTVAQTKLETTQQDVERISKIMLGESEPERGLVMRLRSVEDKLQQIFDEHRAVKNWAWSSIGAGIVSVVTLLAKWVLD